MHSIVNRNSYSNSCWRIVSVLTLSNWNERCFFFYHRRWVLIKKIKHFARNSVIAIWRFRATTRRKLKWAKSQCVMDDAAMAVVQNAQMNLPPQLNTKRQLPSNSYSLNVIYIFAAVGENAHHLKLMRKYSCHGGTTVYCTSLSMRLFYWISW